MTDKKGKPKPDPKKRDTENVPFTYGGKPTATRAGRRLSRRTSRPRSCRTSPTRGSTPRRPRSGTRSRSHDTSTSTCHPGRSRRSTPTSRSRSPRSWTCCARSRRDAAPAGRGSPSSRSSIPAGWTVRRLWYRCCQSRTGDPREEPWSSMILVAPNHVESGTERPVAARRARDQGAEPAARCQRGRRRGGRGRPALNKAAHRRSGYCLCGA